MKIVFISFFFVPLFSLAAPGFYGEDVLIKSKKNDIYLVEQAGFRIQVNGEMLSPGLQEKWKRNIGKVIETSIPYGAVIHEEQLKNYKPKKITHR